MKTGRNRMKICKRVKMPLILALFVFLFMSVYAADTSASSTVTVLDAAAGVSNVPVYAYNGMSPVAISYTDSSGAATFDLTTYSQIEFRINNFQCYSYSSGIVALPATLIVNLPSPSVITVLDEGSPANNIPVKVYNTSGGQIGQPRTGSDGTVKCYLSGGTQFSFKVIKAGNFFAYVSGTYTAPVAPANVNLPASPTVVTVNGIIPSTSATVFAYDNTNAFYGNGTTTGQMDCYIPEGMQAKFVIKYNGFTAGETGLVTTPNSASFTLPAPSTVTVTSGGTPRPGVRVYVKDSVGTPLGNAYTDVAGVVNCYVAEGQLAQFTFIDGDFSYDSSLQATPASLNVDVAPPSTVTVLNAGQGVAGIDVTAKDASDIYMTNAVTDANGVATLTVSSGLQFKYSFKHNGYSHQSALVAAPKDETVNLPAPSTVNVLYDAADGGGGVYNVNVNAFDSGHVYIDNVYTDNSGNAEFYIPSGTQVSFEFLYHGHSYDSGLLTAPADRSTALPPASLLTVADSGSPLVNVFVYAYNTAGGGLGSGMTDAQGNINFYFDGGTDAVFEVDYSSTFYYSDWIGAAPQDTTVDIQLSPIKPRSASGVTVASNRLLVNGSAYKISGVVYQAVPIGEAPWASSWLNDSNIFDRDFPMLNAIGVNTIRTFDKVSDALMDSADQYGIRVIAGYWIDPALDFSDYSPGGVRDTIKDDFTAYVQSFKYKPALLFWAIGNSQGVPLDKLFEWYALVNEMAYEALAIERIHYHPVAIVNDGLGNIDDISYGSDDEGMPYTDIWGTEVLTGNTFGSYFDDYDILDTTKPHWIASYGVDAYDNNAPAEDQAAQALWIMDSTDEIRLSDLTIGGTLNEYSDEWWLDGAASNDWGHDTGGWPSMPGMPDNFFNVEWMGMVEIAADGTWNDYSWNGITLNPSGDNVDDVRPRQAAGELKTIFTAPALPIAYFTASPVSGGAPLTVDFTDASGGDVTTWSWDFDNDTIEDSTLQNPTYVYNTPGIYTVSLSVSGPGGSDSEMKTNYITVSPSGPAPVADFTALPLTGYAPLTVNFTDTSSGTITSWSWDFDNDTIEDSTLQNPTYIYNAAGTYTVTLTVTGPGGSDGVSKTNYITVSGTSTVRIVGDGTYTSLQQAYNAAVEGDIIQSQDFVFVEDLNVNVAKSVTLRCGYDPGYTDNTGGVTILNGNIRIENGTLTIDSGTLRIQ